MSRSFFILYIAFLLGSFLVILMMRFIEVQRCAFLGANDALR